MPSLARILHCCAFLGCLHGLGQAQGPPRDAFREPLRAIGERMDPSRPDLPRLRTIFAQHGGQVILAVGDDLYLAGPGCTCTRSWGAQDEARSLGAQREGRQFADQGETRSWGTGSEGRSLGEDQETRSFGAQAENRQVGQIGEARSHGLEAETRSHGLDAETRSWGQDVRRIACFTKVEDGRGGFFIADPLNRDIYFFDGLAFRKAETTWIPD
jgi:hypothetical protein